MTGSPAASLLSTAYRECLARPVTRPSPTAGLSEVVSAKAGDDPGPPARRSQPGAPTGSHGIEASRSTAGQGEGDWQGKGEEAAVRPGTLRAIGFTPHWQAASPPSPPSLPVKAPESLSISMQSSEPLGATATFPSGAPGSEPGACDHVSVAVAPLPLAPRALKLTGIREEEHGNGSATATASASATMTGGHDVTSTNSEFEGLGSSVLLSESTPSSGPPRRVDFSRLRVVFVDDGPPNQRVGLRFLKGLGVLPTNIRMMCDGTLQRLLSWLSLAPIGTKHTDGSASPQAEWQCYGKCQ